MCLHIMRNQSATNEPRHKKPCFCECENKGADHLGGNSASDQCLCFHYIDNTRSLYFLNPKFQAFIHIVWLYSPVSETPKTGFLLTRLIIRPVKPMISDRLDVMVFDLDHI